MTREVEARMAEWLRSDNPVLRRAAEHRFAIATGAPLEPVQPIPPTPEDLALRAYVARNGCCGG